MPILAPTRCFERSEFVRAPHLCGKGGELEKHTLVVDRGSRVFEALKDRLGQEHFETWFSHTTLQETDDGALELRTPNQFVLEWVKQNFQRELQEAILLNFEAPAELRFVVTKGEAKSPVETTTTSPSSPPGVSDRRAGSAPTSPPQASWSPRISEPGRPAGATPIMTPVNEPVSMRDRNVRYLQRHSNVQLNDEYSFANFVVGSGNRFCHAASLAVSDDPAKAYNPLFLHGSVGLGKTHLMQAICHGLLQRETPINVVYLTCERFVNEFISAIETGRLEAFRDRYRQADVLLIDDIQFLGKKERTQEEFFHTFNALHENKRQIVLSSDAPPREIPNLEARLVSRFKWGLVAEIHPPDYETRMAIVKKKSKLRGQELPDDVADYISTRIKTNIRELEGAVVKILGFASLMGRKIDASLAREAFSDGSVVDSGRISCDRIIETVCQYFDVRKTEIQSKRRLKSIAFPRQIGMYLARKNTSHSLEEIGAYFGNRDHSTVLYAADKIEKNLQEDAELRSTLDKLDHILKNKG